MFVSLQAQHILLAWLSERIGPGFAQTIASLCILALRFPGLVVYERHQLLRMLYARDIATDARVALVVPPPSIWTALGSFDNTTGSLLGFFKGFKPHCLEIFLQSAVRFLCDKAVDNALFWMLTKASQPEFVLKSSLEDMQLETNEKVRITL